MNPKFPENKRTNSKHTCKTNQVPDHLKKPPDKPNDKNNKILQPKVTTRSGRLIKTPNRLNS